MRNHFHIFGLAASLWLPLSAYAAMPDNQHFAEIEKGRYLTSIADCAACHTNPGQNRPFAGGRPIETPFGTLVTPNITPDAATGIGAWTSQQFDDAVRRGKRPDGSRLYPAMPYTHYTKMSRDDVLAIRAYLSTLAPVHNVVVPNQLPFPFNIRAAMRAWDALFFREGELHPDPNKSDAWNRGAYLVEGPGHCGACHTAKNFMGADKDSEKLRGSALQGWFAPDITNDPTRGIGGWSADDIVRFLKTGHNQNSAATGPMAEEVKFSSSHMTDSDLAAIAAYLKDVPGRTDHPGAIAVDDPEMKSGQAIYRDVCSACHALQGNGVPNLFPALSKSALVRSDDPATGIRLVLRGARSVATNAEPTSPGMPAFDWQLNNEQIAAVLTYIRNSWGNAAPRVTADAVRSTKAALAARRN